ncbi:Uncharacterised protein [Vibrio cholerae]|nr:Uncharacterised protein [Vibrio cholerae]
MLLELRRRRQIERPSSPGNIKSSTIKWKFSRVSRRSICSPLATLRT